MTIDSKAVAATPADAARSRTWTAKMIAPEADAGQGTPASFLAGTVRLESVADGAELVASALGLYRCFLNGRRVGRDLLTPGFTCYDDRIAFQRYDVSSFLVPGENRLEIWLGDGWFRSPLMWGENPIANCWGARTAAIAELRVGGRLVLATDETWRSGRLPIERNGIYFGEIYDARRDVLAETQGIEVLAFDANLLVPHETAPVRELDPIAPIETWTDAEGRIVYDFGQNVAGFVRYTVEGDAGAEVRFEHSEVLGPDRFFDNRNYRRAEAHTIYRLKGGAPETYAPHFSFQGFRYARASVTGTARITAVASVPITSVPDLKAGFSCGHPLVDRLFLNTVWSQRGNFIEVPTDCPQRDERLGWTGDAQVFAGTACWLADSHGFLRKYLRDVLADQRPDGAISHFSPDPTRLHPQNFAGFAGSTGWGDAIVVIPWVLYTHYDDRDVLTECLPAMQRWLDFVWSISDGPIVRPSPRWGERGFSFGDWLQPVGDNRMPRPTVGADCAATLYHFISTDLAARIAGVLGETAIAARLAERATAIRAAFAHEFITPSGRLAHNDQTSYALAFLHDLVPPEHVEAAKGHFRRIVEEADHKIGTGFIGTPALLPALTKLGMDDLAARVFLQEDVPGWLYQVRQGATTIWERWDAMAPDGTIHEPEMNSYNHYAYGAVCQWLFESVAGLAPDPDAPGFARVVIDPAPVRELAPLRAHHDSVRGRIEASWTIETDDVVRYRVTLPEGTQGVFRPSARHDEACVNGRAATGETVLPAGTHEITFRLAA